jgi:hypothetical protein
MDSKTASCASFEVLAKSDIRSRNADSVSPAIRARLDSHALAARNE